MGLTPLILTKVGLMGTNITKNEIKKIISIFIMLIGTSLVESPLVDFTLKSFPNIGQFTLGALVILIGAYIFKIK